MKISIFYLSVLLLLTTGCNIAGPAFPKKYGSEFLQSHGYSDEIIKAVINQNQLEHKSVIAFSKCDSADVRFLVASNPYLKPDEIDLFMNDNNDFARSGTACNKNLTRSQMLTLMQDSSHTVYCKLAGNPSVPEELLLELHNKRKPGLVWFATNPNCPESIRQDIQKSSDSLAKRWLEIVDGWKKDGKYIKGNDGRWLKP